MNDFDKALIAFFRSERTRPAIEAIADRIVNQGLDDPVATRGT